MAMRAALRRAAEYIRRDQIPGIRCLAAPGSGSAPSPRNHRFAFDQQFGIVPVHDVKHYAVSLPDGFPPNAPGCCFWCSMLPAAPTARAVSKAHALTRIRRSAAAVGSVRRGPERSVCVCHQTIHRISEVADLRIVQRPLSARARNSTLLHWCAPREKLAMWLPCRVSLAIARPVMFIRSPLTSVSARWQSSAFSSTIAAEISGCLTAKGAPKPQQPPCAGAPPARYLPQLSEQSLVISGDAHFTACGAGRRSATFTGFPHR